MSDRVFKRDPMTQRWWSLAMALAWALWKTPERVDWAWHEKALDYGHNEPLSINGVLWHYKFDAIVAGNRSGADAQSSQILSKLADALENERICGQGEAPGHISRRVVTPNEWEKACLSALTVASCHHSYDDLYTINSEKLLIQNVRVLREDVMKEFIEGDCQPEIISLSEINVEATLNAEAQASLQERINAEVIRLPANLSFAEFLQALKAALPHDHVTIAAARIAHKSYPTKRPNGVRGLGKAIKR